MEQPKPIIKLNGGKPIALCNRCYCIMCYVYCIDKNLDENGNWVVIERWYSSGVENISTPIGKVPPSFCDKCFKLLFK